jgi:tRNA (guanosine-2'-O-)-methyltransferase
VSQLDGTGLKRLHRDWRRRTEGRVALLLDGVSSTYNVGSILRTAAAERVEHLWFTGGATPPRAPGVAKTALGTERYLTWTTGGTGAECIAEIKAAGWRVVGVELTTDAVPLHELALAEQPTCLAIGHEDRGLAPTTLEACDAVGFIPQLGRVGSLNVAVATAIALYEARRQGWVGPPNPD